MAAASPPSDAARGRVLEYTRAIDVIADYPHLAEDITAIGFEAMVHYPLRVSSTDTSDGTDRPDGTGIPHGAGAPDGFTDAGDRGGSRGGSGGGSNGSGKSGEPQITPPPNVDGDLRAEQGGVVGALGLAWREPRELTGAERQVIEALAAFNAQAVSRLQLAAHQRHSAEVLQRALLPELPRTVTLPAEPRLPTKLTPLIDLARSAKVKLTNTWPPLLQVRGRDGHMLSTATASFTRQAPSTAQAAAIVQAGVAARYVPAAAADHVGGDWYDVTIPADGVPNLVIGDVAGHDIEAAAAMGELRGLLSAFVWDRPEPLGSVVDRLDVAIDGLATPARAGKQQASLVLARLHAHRDGGAVLSWTNAGHPPPVLLLADGSTQVLRNPAELLVGVLSATERSEHRAYVPAGATLLLVTDGLIEHRDRDLDVGL